MTEPAEYEVFWSRAALDALRTLRDAISDPSLRAALAEVIKALDQRLRENPVEVGEVYRTTGSVHEHLAAYRLIAIDFAVDVARRVVIVRHVRALPALGS